MKHVTVYSEPGTYAGWPANHGAWQWGDELLVGFLTGQHNIGGIHNVLPPFTKRLARSLDGGETWTVEDPGVDFRGTRANHPPEFNLGSSIIRVCGYYDHGGEDAPKRGSFYLSDDRGHTWSSPFRFDGVDELMIEGGRKCSARTAVLRDRVFLSHRAGFGTDISFCAYHDGRRFHYLSTLIDDGQRAVMPQAAMIGDRIVAVLRRRSGHRRSAELPYWIGAVVSDDGGQTWSDEAIVGDTGNDNGNPAALVACGGVLWCAYANRRKNEIRLSRSTDGVDWTLAGVIRKGSESDIGYPQMFVRSDGRLVCVYYWSDDYEAPQRIEASIFDPEALA